MLRRFLSLQIGENSGFQQTIGQIVITCHNASQLDNIPTGQAVHCVVSTSAVVSDGQPNCRNSLNEFLTFDISEEHQYLWQLGH